MNDLSDATIALRDFSPIVFVNGAAGGNHTRLHLPRIQKFFALSHLDAKFVMTRSSAELERSARAAIAGKHRLLLVMGGDGTFQALVNAAFGADVLLGVLPSGGGNDFAAALGLPGDPMKSAEAVLRGTPRFLDLVRVRTGEGRTRLYVGGGGIGLDARATHYSSGPYRQLPGRWRYTASALRALVGFVPLDVRVDFPGSDFISHEAKVLLAAVLNSPTYGAGVRLAPGATLNDGSLHAVLIEDIGAFEILQLLPRLMGSGELRTSRVKRWQVRKVRLTTQNPTVFHGDGEILGSTPVEIEIVPRAIQVLAPCRE